MADAPRTSPLAVRLPEGMKERLDVAAHAHGMARNALVVRSLERTLATLAQDDALPHDRLPCPHPEASRKTLGDTFCGECGAIVVCSHR